ncbi:CheW protein [Desulfovibrio sp. X2]|uniref:chemotaxis protein CheW n=1 Tax=Desulfovibrio sp. X2 TaxID=941449 RepID=UPI000358D9FC|nr:chemotaxis protein CheW [Desulfovibrio sp. X2]EPR42100.1 CheW protein [Desulfovibrio sp. X2]
MESEMRSGQFLTFVLDEENYALPISVVREVLEYTNITRVPRTPAAMRGVINLRGHAVAVVDMRLKLGLNETDPTVSTCIIITETDMGDGPVILGALVDAVREVVDIEAASVEPAPKMGLDVDTTYLKGMAQQEDGFVMILDVDNIFTAEDLLSLSCREPAECEAATA